MVIVSAQPWQSVPGDPTSVDCDYVRSRVLDHHLHLHQPTSLSQNTGAMPQVYKQLFRNYTPPLHPLSCSH